MLRSSADDAPEAIFATESGSRAFGAGDRIVFTRNDKQIGVKNGMLGTVESAEAESIGVVLDDDDGTSRRVTFDPQSYRSFDHGYAVTIHKSQGATVDRAYVLVSRTMDAPLAYVAMTRHRDVLRLYLSDKNRPIWAESADGYHPRRRQTRARTFDR